ncbi:MAG: aromatic amino acid hydroxylase [Bacteroidales bacterium]|nr:aromatic amino acid hydroxylase [Bacteroidales bacterium]
MKTKNINVKRLPKHLRKYIVDQNYEKYTAIDHAVWRYIMRLNYDFLKESAHASYLDGLVKTGISIEKIPQIDEMNEILSKIGWGAVCVDGFIPPTAFMEFQAYKILVIAADMRNINHIEYTPAPDIVHEAAGHAPIIVNPAYAEYLRLFGEIGSKAISSKRDNDLYEAIRKISIIKENPKATAADIQNAEKELAEIQNDLGEPSEMARLRNLHWWTVEYGLIGPLEKPQIYGAGLLSSIGESAACMKEHVKKLPYSIAAADYGFDITNQQPQLFVCNNFTHLLKVLNEFADTMAFRKGGTESIKMAIESNALATCQLSSGLQISGIFTRKILSTKDEVVYINTSGPTVLSENDKMIIGHGKKAHKEGFGTPLGTLENTKFNLEDMSLDQLEELQIKIGHRSILNFESGVKVDGILQYVHQNKYGKILIMSFESCKVTLNEDVLFEPEWGTFDMAVGEKIVSVFAGAADKEAFESETYISPTSTITNNYTDKQYINLYQSVRDLREIEFISGKLSDIFEQVKQQYPDDWLLSVELYELAYNQKDKAAHKIKTYLAEKSMAMAHNHQLISDGIKLIEK